MVSATWNTCLVFGSVHVEGQERTVSVVSVGRLLLLILNSSVLLLVEQLLARSCLLFGRHAQLALRSVYVGACPVQCQALVNLGNICRLLMGLVSSHTVDCETRLELQLLGLALLLFRRDVLLLFNDASEAATCR